MGDLKLVGLHHLSPSGTATLQRCERLYVGKYGPERIREEGSEATAMGGGLALALETGSIAAGLREYHARAPRDLLLDDAGTVERLTVIAESIITHAAQAYEARFGDAHMVEREVTYLCDMPGVSNGRLLQVRVDGVCKPGRYLVEDKLRAGSSLRPEQVENEVRQGRQLTAEIYGHWRATGEIWPVRFRLLRKPDPRPLKSCSLNELEERIAHHFAQERSVDEREVFRTEAQLMAWEQEQLALGRRADELLLPADRYVDPPVRNTSACFDFGRACPLLAECQGIRQDLGALDAA